MRYAKSKGEIVVDVEQVLDHTKYYLFSKGVIWATHELEKLLRLKNFAHASDELAKVEADCLVEMDRETLETAVQMDVGISISDIEME